MQLASEPWIVSRFECRDKVAARIRLGAGGRVLVERGGVGEIIKVLRDTQDGVGYHVVFTGCNPLLVPESALEAITEETREADLSPPPNHSLPA